MISIWRRKPHNSEEMLLQFWHKMWYFWHCSAAKVHHHLQTAGEHGKWPKLILAPFIPCKTLGKGNECSAWYGYVLWGKNLLAIYARETLMSFHVLLTPKRNDDLFKYLSAVIDLNQKLWKLGALHNWRSCPSFLFTTTVLLAHQSVTLMQSADRPPPPRWLIKTSTLSATFQKVIRENFTLLRKKQQQMCDVVKTQK